MGDINGLLYVLHILINSIFVLTDLHCVYFIFVSTYVFGCPGITNEREHQLFLKMRCTVLGSDRRPEFNMCQN